MFLCLKKTIHQQLQEGLNTSKLNPLSKCVNMRVRTAMPVPVHPPRAQQLQHKAHWVQRCLLVESFPSTSPCERCAPQCHAVLQPLHCSAAPKPPVVATGTAGHRAEKTPKYYAVNAWETISSVKEQKAGTKIHVLRWI